VEREPAAHNHTVSDDRLDDDSAASRNEDKLGRRHLLLLLTPAAIDCNTKHNDDEKRVLGSQE